jgi:hypothetical protein
MEVIRKEIDLVRFQARRYEREILATIEYGNKIMDDLFLTGLRNTFLCIESRVYYQKIIADFSRYKCELKLQSQRWEKESGSEAVATDLHAVVKETKMLYIQACEEAEVMEPSNSLRLSLFLNYSVFLYEIC